MPDGVVRSRHFRLLLAMLELMMLLMNTVITPHIFVTSPHVIEMRVSFNLLNVDTKSVNVY